MSTNANAVPPSTLHLLRELASLAQGTKVRFQGCVSSYDHRSATLHLTDRFPCHSARHTASVDVSHVLDSLGGTALLTGAWVDVIGYVTESLLSGAPAPGVDSHGRLQMQPGCACVQAVALWSAGGVGGAPEPEMQRGFWARRTGMRLMAESRARDAKQREASGVGIVKDDQPVAGSASGGKRVQLWKR